MVRSLIVGVLALHSAGWCQTAPLTILVAPQQLPVNKASQSLALTLTNVNVQSELSLQTGDRLALYLNLGDGDVRNLNDRVAVSGVGFSDGDWAASIGSFPSEIFLTFTGQDKRWSAGASVSLRLTVRTPSREMAGLVVLRVPSGGRFGGNEWILTPFNAVEDSLLQTGPKGEKGDPGDRGPLVSTPSEKSPNLRSKISHLQT